MAKPVNRPFQQYMENFYYKYKRYIPNAYDETYTLLEKVDKLIDDMNDMGLLVNDVVDLWKQVMDWVMDEGLTESVHDKLDEMVADGTFDKIINEELFATKADKDVLDRFMNETNYEMNLKAPINTVWGMDSLSQDVKEAMTGGSVPVVGENAITNVNIVNGQVSPNKTSFFKPTRNLFNKYNTLRNKVIGPLTGAIVDGENRWVSERMELKPNTTYKRNDYGVTAFYDQNGTFISSTDEYTFRTTGNTKYTRIDTNNINTCQLEEGEVTTEYIGYYSSLENDVNVYDDNLDYISEWGALNLPIRIETNPIRIIIPFNVSVFTSKERIRVPTTNNEDYVLNLNPQSGNWIVLFNKRSRSFSLVRYEEAIGNFNPNSYLVIGVMFASELTFSTMSPYYIGKHRFGIDVDSSWGALNLPIRIETNPMRVIIPYNVSVYSAKERIRVPTTNTRDYVFNIDPPNNNWVILYDKELRTFSVTLYDPVVGIYNPNSYIVVGIFFASQQVLSSLTPYYINGHLYGINVQQQSQDNPAYPKTMTWGNEYLHSYYKKLLNNDNILMSWAGDSTTEQTSSISNPAHRRNALGKKIVTKGGFSDSQITSLNKGHGGNTTLDWLNQWLDEDMAQNPDLYILGYGLNDGGTNYFGGTIQDRVTGFETRLRNGLNKIRNTLNKKATDMAIILCMPVATNDPTNRRTVTDWNNHIRPVIQKACRDYQCAFIDLTSYEYDRTYSSSWSSNGDNVHPDAVSTIDYMSLFKPLLLPTLFEK